MVTKLGVVMDPIAMLNPKKDSTLAMMLAAQDRGWEIFSIEQSGLYIQEGEVFTHRHQVKVFDDLQHWLRSSIRDICPSPILTLC